MLDTVDASINTSSSAAEKHPKIEQHSTSTSTFVEITAGQGSCEKHDQATMASLARSARVLAIMVLVIATVIITSTPLVECSECFSVLTNSSLSFPDPVVSLSIYHAS
jgi:hypothetical protein